MSQSFRLRLSRNSLKLKVATRIPAQLVAGTGVSITKANGIYTFDLDEDEIEDIAEAAAAAAVTAAVGVDIQAYDADLAALAANSTDGLWTHTAAGTGSARTITGTAAEVTVTNGNGVSGNPTISLPSAITLTGKTMTGGTFGSPTINTPNIVGTATNDAAAAGSVGELMTNSVGTTALTSTISINVGQLSLTAGDWEVYLFVRFSGAGSTITTDTHIGINTVSATLPSFALGQSNQWRGSITDLIDTRIAGPFRVSLASTTTYYGVANATFTVAGLNASGTLRARRVR
jgi:hypothetical protein